MPHTSSEISAAIAQSLKQHAHRVVFAESCTAGLVAATLAQIPGISEFLCGSAVAYRLDTKHRWLGIPTDLLADPGPVSHEVAEAMCAGVLRITPEADWAASVTGHLGPNAPDGEDGLIFIGIAQRHESSPQGLKIATHQHWLGDPTSSSEGSLRLRRQQSAAQLVLQTLHEALQRE
ncbi:MAG: nicotinamide-nucleotide amidohydrolase family protein [Planctomycetaceae bacterium]